eukprot:1601162-Rhodomonas_salina.5
MSGPTSAPRSRSKTWGLYEGKEEEAPAQHILVDRGQRQYRTSHTACVGRYMRHDDVGVGSRASW